MDPITARKTWRTLEPLHGMIYFTPEGPEEYAAIGLRGSRAGYFASRAAAMGAVPSEVVIATFFNFESGLVRAAMDGAWAVAPPARVVEARFRAVDRALRRAFGDEIIASSDLADAAALARGAALTACEHPYGRALFAGHAALPWPDEPHLVLWHAQTLLREFRGDGHVAALLDDGLTGIEALVVHAATGEIPVEILRTSRAWSDDAWDVAVDGLVTRGIIAATAPLTLTEAGRARRQAVEDRTDDLSVVAYEPLGDAGCQRLRALGRPLSRAVIDAGLLP